MPGERRVHARLAGPVGSDPEPTAVRCVSDFPSGLLGVRRACDHLLIIETAHAFYWLLLMPHYTSANGYFVKNSHGRFYWTRARRGHLWLVQLHRRVA